MQASKEVFKPNESALWWAGKELLKEKLLSEFVGKNEKTKLDKEWNQISKLIDKRKSGDFGSFGTKKPKY